MRSSTKGIAEGAIVTAIYMVLLWLTLYAPLIGTITSLILSVPFIVVGSRQTTKVTVLTALAATLVAGLLIGPGAGLRTALFALIGSAMGVSYQKYKGSWTALSIGFLTTIIGFIFMLVVMSTLFEFNVTQFMKDYMNESIKMAESITGSGNSEQINLFKQSVDLLVMLLPALIIIAAILTTMINHIVGIRVLRRLGTNVPTLPPFKDWKLPRILLFYYLISLILSFIPGLSSIQAIQTIVMNSVYLLGALFMVQGVSFVAYYSWAKGLGKTPIVFVIIGMFLLAGFGFPYFVSLLGMIDLGFDIRAKINRKG